MLKTIVHHRLTAYFKYKRCQKQASVNKYTFWRLKFVKKNITDS